MRDDKVLSPQESLQLISSMIESAKSSISDKSRFFLLWGWATFIGCLLQFYLLVVARSPHHYYAWFITLAAIVLHLFFMNRYRGETRVKTFISDATVYVWTAIGFSYIVLFVVFSKVGWQYCFPFYILLYGIGTYISGSLLKFMPMRLGGAACLFLVPITPFLDYPLQILISGLAILISYIIPGHLLRLRYRRINRKEG